MKQKRRMLGLCLWLVSMLLLAACSEELPSTGIVVEEQATQLTEDTTYYNRYLGVSTTIPKGWWLYECDVNNYQTDPAATADVAALDIRESSGYRSLTLIRYANLQYSNRDGHLEFSLLADQINQISSFDAYMEDYLEYLLTSKNGIQYELVDQGSFLLGEQEVRSVLLTATYEDSGVSYGYYSAVIPVSQGYYLVIDATYWPQNTEAPALIQQHIEDYYHLGE